MLLKWSDLGALQLFLCLIIFDLLESLAVGAMMHQTGGIEARIKQIGVFLEVADAQFADVLEVALSECFDHFVEFLGLSLVRLVVAALDGYFQAKPNFLFFN
jgi:hypothetical protein